MKHSYTIQRLLIIAVIAVLFILVISSVAVVADKPGSCQKTDGSLWCGKSAGSCWCDKSCVKYGDCCSDIKDVCLNLVPKCGNNVIDQEGEECDGTQFKYGIDCPFGGYYECTKDCKLSKQFCKDPDPIYCTDSDGGINPFVKGTFSQTGGQKATDSDYCMGEANLYLYEYYCLDTGKVNSKIFGPNTGCQQCKDGACVKPEEPPTTLPCTDSDGGMNIFDAGTAAQQGTEKMSDYCIDNGEQKGYLVEYYCSNTGKIDSKIYGPNEGCQQCANGACLSLPKPQPITKKDVLNWITNNC